MGDRAEGRERPIDLALLVEGSQKHGCETRRKGQGEVGHGHEVYEPVGLNLARTPDRLSG
jgi:hypothetical protein